MSQVTKPILLDETGREMTSALNNIAAAISFVRPVATDLSKIGVDGAALYGRTTANCYVVNKAGYYQIPLLYGAAVKDGVENAAAYTNEGGELQTDFVNPYGEVIRNSSIETDQRKAAFADICLADADNAVTNIALADGGDCKYLCFRVPAIPQQGANVLISVFDANGHVMWTFHIWLWSRSLAPITFVNHTGVEYPLMPVNLGSKLDADLVHIKNWLYQHGRVNPMPCPAAYNSNSNHALFGAKSYGTQAAGSIADALAAPQNFVLQDGEEFYNWFVGGTKYNLWDAHCSAAGASDNNVVKTVYDPCPVGWKVPAGRAFTGFTATGGNTSTPAEFNVVGGFDAGWKFKKDANDAVGQLFPASGYRGSTSGGLSSVGGSGDYWSAAAYSRADAYTLSFYSGDVTPLLGSGRANGFSVRPSLDI